MSIYGDAGIDIDRIKAIPLEQVFVKNGALSVAATIKRISSGVYELPPPAVQANNAACMLKSREYKKQMELFAREATAHTGAVVWTILDASYADMVADVMEMTSRDGNAHSPMLFGCLDETALVAVCNAGGHAVLFPKGPGVDTKVRHVADAKFGMAGDLLALSVSFLFFEMDIWLLRSPMPLFQDQRAEIFISSHQHNQLELNIGMYFVRPTKGTQRLFTSLRDGNAHSPMLFDQDLFSCFLKNSRQLPHRHMAAKWQSSCQKPLMRDSLEQVKAEEGSEVVFNISWRVLDANAVVASSKPSVHHPTTLAVHVLSGRPLTGARGKRWVAKELQLWEGANGYYSVGHGGVVDEAAAASGGDDGGGRKGEGEGTVATGGGKGEEGGRFLVYDGLFGMNSAALSSFLVDTSRGIVQRESIRKQEEGLQTMLRYMVALAVHTNRTLVLPEIADYRGKRMFAASTIDVDRLAGFRTLEGREELTTPLLQWRESSFLANRRTRVCGNVVRVVVGRENAVVVPLAGGGGRAGFSGLQQGGKETLSALDSARPLTRQYMEAVQQVSSRAGDAPEEEEEEAQARLQQEEATRQEQLWGVLEQPIARDAEVLALRLQFVHDGHFPSTSAEAVLPGLHSTYANTQDGTHLFNRTGSLLAAVGPYIRFCTFSRDVQYGVEKANWRIVENQRTELESTYFCRAAS
jgi:hypothetical protein